MRRSLRRRSGVARAWAGLGASVVVVGLAAAGAWHVPEPEPARAEPTGASAFSDLPARPVNRDARTVMRVVELAPFRPDRTRPASRYRMPSERRAFVATPGRPAYSTFRLTGLVEVGHGRSLAAIARPGQPSRLFTVGANIDGFELTAIENGTATLVGPDTTLVLEMRKTRGDVR